jgi:hypothetical protein
MPPVYPRCHCDGFQFFLDLPRELRDNVYRFLVADLPSRVFVSSRMPLSALVLQPDTLPSISFVSKRLQSESVLIYLQRTRFIFDDMFPRTVEYGVQPLEAFLHRFDRGFESIRMLTFHDVSRFGSARLPDDRSPATFITRCTGLRDLVIQFRFSYLLHFEVVDEEMDVEPRVRLLKKSEIKDRWGLDGLFEMEKLESVRFKCAVARWHMDDYNFESADEIVGNLSEVIKEGFEEHGRLLTWSVEAVLPS